ncbi:MAG: hypothetical protein ACLTK0_05695 [Anaerovoracaceae bacterium]
MRQDKGKYSKYVKLKIKEAIVVEEETAAAVQAADVDNRDPWIRYFEKWKLTAYEEKG